MKSGLVCAKLFSGITLGMAQLQVERDCSANYYFGRADEFLNKSIMLIVTDIEVPAENAGTEDNYRIFDVRTGYREKVPGESRARSIETGYEGNIRVVIEKEKAHQLVASLQKARANNTYDTIHGTFKKWDLSNNKPKSGFYVDLRE